MFKKWTFPAGLIIAVLITFYIYRKYHVPPTIRLTELNLVGLDEKPVKLGIYKGKKMVVCFGASWCGNCWDELKDIASIKKSDLGDVEILVISDEPVERVRAFRERAGYPFTFLKMLEPFNTIGVNSLPTSYIVNKRFEIKKETVGYIHWKDPSTLEHLKKLMD
jgi:peroxiredoxin